MIIEKKNYIDNAEQLSDFIISITSGEFEFFEWENYFRFKLPLKLKNVYNEFYTVKDNNKIIGICGFFEEDKVTVRLSNFYVDYKYRNQNIGKSLYKICKQSIREKGYEKIILKTNKKFNIAIKFYEKQGFKLYKLEDEELWYELKL